MRLCKLLKCLKKPRKSRRPPTFARRILALESFEFRLPLTSYVAGLDGVSPVSTFEFGETQQLSQNAAAPGWTKGPEAHVVLWDIPNHNGALIGGQPYENYTARYLTGVAVSSNSQYTLRLDMGFVAGIAGGSATAQFALGTWDGATFSPLESATQTVVYAGNLSGGSVSASATLSLSTGSVVPTQMLAVQLRQLSTAGLSDFFGFDNVVLEADVPVNPIATVGNDQTVSEGMPVTISGTFVPGDRPIVTEHWSVQSSNGEVVVGNVITQAGVVTQLLNNGDFELPPILGAGQSGVPVGESKYITTSSAGPLYNLSISGVSSWTYATPFNGVHSDHGLARRNSSFGLSSVGQSAFINNWGRLMSQTASPLLAAGDNVTASIDVGTLGSDFDNGRAGRFYLVAGEVNAANADQFSGRSIVLDEISVANASWPYFTPDVVIPNGRYVPLNLSYTYLPNDPALGLPVTIAFRTETSSVGPTYWDNARLELSRQSVNAFTFTPHDDGEYTVTYTVTDDQGRVGTDSVVITVTNMLPNNLAMNGAGVVRENSVYTLSGTFDDPGTLDVHTLRIDWGEGTPQFVTVPPGARSFSVDHTYLDDNPTGDPSNDYTITVTLVDDDTPVADYATEVLSAIPAAYWRLGEASGTVARDSSGNGHHATYMNSPIRGVAGLLPNSSDTAVRFNGTSHHITAPFSFNPDATSFTVETLFQVDTVGTVDTLIQQRDDGTGVGRELLFIDSDRRIKSRLGNAIRNSNFQVTAGVAYHVALVYQQNTAPGSGVWRFYINGTLTNSGSVNPESATGSLFLARNKTAINFAGILDEAAIYLHPLSANEVRDHFLAIPITSRTATVRVENVAPAPDAGDDQTVDEGSLVTLSAEVNDVGSQDSHTHVWTVAASNGQVVAEGSEATFSFTPTDEGTYVVTHRVRDDDGGEGTDSVQINVLNAAPLAIADSSSGDENQVVSANVIDNDIDAGILDVLSLVDDSAVVLSITRNLDGTIIPVDLVTLSQNGNSITMDPGTALDSLNIGDAATVLVQYRVTDDDNDSAVGYWAITMVGSNDAPVARADYVTTIEDETVLGNVLANDSDVDDTHASLRVVAVDGDSSSIGQRRATPHGEVVVYSDGSYRYMPGAICQATNDSFTYTVSDPQGMTSINTVVITMGQFSGSSRADGVLRIGGTAARDVVSVSGNKLIVNGTPHSLAGVRDLRIWGREGNDVIDLNGLSIAAFVHGGGGNDVITGGGGDDLILGGDGDDILTGAAGHDFLIGGRDKDRIVGASGNDILVAAEFGCQFNLTALREMGQAWANSHSVTDVALEEILNEPPSDTSGDKLTGSSGADLFIIADEDEITDFHLGQPKTNKDGDVVLQNGIVIR